MFKTWHIELEVPEGLEDISLREVEQHFATSKPKRSRDGILTFSCTDSFKKLERLHTVYASYVVLEFPIPRPKALLGHQYFTQIIETCQAIIKENAFKTVAINAAGSDSSVMQRILTEVGAGIGLTPTQDEGDLLIRIRKLKGTWQVLVRTTPRPLSTKQWRIHDYQGALNAPVAYGMNQLITPQHQTAYANFMCGSGTLLIERDQPTQLVYGIDNNPYALSMAQEHLIQAQIPNVQLVKADAMQVPFADNSFSAITADLPFGQLVGSHNENRKLYPASLQEMHRTLVIGGVLVLITHEVNLLGKIIQTEHWRLIQQRKTNLRGLHPRIYLLEKQ